MRTVFLSAGHSSTDPGAVANGRKEADIAVEFRNMVSFYLSRDSIAHVLDGSGTQNLPLREAVAVMKRSDIGVEFHCNAAASAAATGVEALSATGDKALAARLSEAVADALLLRNRGAKAENSGQHSRLAFVQAGGVIVELLFITNEQDLAAYDARKWLAAKAVADVLIEEAQQ